MARIWRDGQKKACVVYRLLTTGTIDEKIFQRQMQKGEFADVVNRPALGSAQQFTREELKRIFTLVSDTASETVDILRAAATSNTQWRNELGRSIDGPLEALNGSGICSFAYLQPGVDTSASTTGKNPSAGHAGSNEAAQAVRADSAAAVAASTDEPRSEMVQALAAAKALKDDGKGAVSPSSKPCGHDSSRSQGAGSASAHGTATESDDVDALELDNAL